jgi:hypothetical protein
MSTSTQALVDARAARRTDAMFRAMSTDYLLREQFATDPMQIFCDYVFADQTSGLEEEATNQLIFSVFSNPVLRQWLGAYSRRLGGKSPSRHVFASQFATAIAASRDPLVALALVRGAAADKNLFERQADFFRAVLATMGRGSAASGTEMSPGGGTEVSPGGGTEISPGSTSFGVVERLAAELASASRFTAELRRVEADGTEMSPGGGTEVSPGGGTEISPGALRLGEALMATLRRAELFSAEILRAASGTEVSPGTATEISPGAATEMSPGAARLSERLAAEVGIAARLASSIVRAESGGTEISPGGGTEVSPGGGTEISPGALRLGEALTAALRRAELFLGEMVRATSGTEMSPGGGTEISPGQTFGGQWGVQLQPHVTSSLGAIVQYAVELKMQGALSASGLETE